MFPTASTSSAAPAPVPRIRRDVPYLTLSSDGVPVCPAPTGMFPRLRWACARRRSAPCIRGAPRAATHLPVAVGCSPHPRGCSYAQTGHGVLQVLLPARAGRTLRSCVPRTAPSTQPPGAPSARYVTRTGRVSKHCPSSGLRLGSGPTPRSCTSAPATSRTPNPRTSRRATSPLRRPPPQPCPDRRGGRSHHGPGRNQGGECRRPASRPGQDRGGVGDGRQPLRRPGGVVPSGPAGPAPISSFRRRTILSAEKVSFERSIPCGDCGVGRRSNCQTAPPDQRPNASTQPLRGPKCRSGSLVRAVWKLSIRPVSSAPGFSPTCSARIWKNSPRRSSAIERPIPGQESHG